MSYGGEVSPEQCWEALKSGTRSILVDVRTRAEWAYVGAPALAEGMNPLVGQEWQVFPQMHVDADFVPQLQAKIAGLNLGSDADLYFLCRSGVRSLAAARAMTAAGYPNTFNVTGGFEGDINEHGHRGHKNGWKAEGLPWQQR